LLQLCVVYALPSLVAQSTSFADSKIVASTPTPPPRARPDLLRRDGLDIGAISLTVDDNVCGWVNGNMHTAFSCIQKHATCFWDTDMKMVGCGNTDVMPFVTSCYDYASASNCDSSCAANPSNFICSSTEPYCNTVNFPDSYSMLPCGKTPNHQLTVAITYNDEKTPVAGLPRYFTVATSSASPTAIAKSDGQKVSTGQIIAAAIGGAVLLIGLPFGVKMYMRKRKWRKTQRPRRLQEREMRREWAEPTNPYMNEVIPIPSPTAGGSNFLFSQDWHGKSATGRSPNYEMQGNG